MNKISISERFKLYIFNIIPFCIYSIVDQWKYTVYTMKYENVFCFLGNLLLSIIGPVLPPIWCIVIFLIVMIKGSDPQLYKIQYSRLTSWRQ